jgi:translocation and assembly module TamB
MAARGRIRTRRVEASLANNLSAEVVELDVIEVGGESAPAGAAAARRRRLDVALDLDVQVPGQAYLRGRGLDSEWAGELKVAGTTGAPKISGRLRAVRGRFSLLGEDFTLVDSTVEIALRQGRPDVLLNLSAVNKSQDLEVYVDVRGWASLPKLTWRSVPVLPQDEIISRLLFDKGTGELTPFEAVQLASALAELTGRGGAPLLDTLRRAIGVDTLRVAGEGADGPKLEAGKYLSEQVYVGVQQGTAGGSSGARIELKVLPNVSVETEVEATGGANIGAKFKWDY